MISIIIFLALMCIVIYFSAVTGEGVLFPVGLIISIFIAFIIDLGLSSIVNNFAEIEYYKESQNNIVLIGNDIITNEITYGIVYSGGDISTRKIDLDEVEVDKNENSYARIERYESRFVDDTIDFWFNTFESYYKVIIPYNMLE